MGFQSPLATSFYSINNLRKRLVATIKYSWNGIKLGRCINIKFLNLEKLLEQSSMASTPQLQEMPYSTHSSLHQLLMILMLWLRRQRISSLLLSWMKLRQLAKLLKLRLQLIIMLLEMHRNKSNITRPWKLLSTLIKLLQARLNHLLWKIRKLIVLWLNHQSWDSNFLKSKSFTHT